MANNKHQNGFAAVIVAFVIVAAVLAGAGVWFRQTQIIKPNPLPAVQKTENQSIVGEKEVKTEVAEPENPTEIESATAQAEPIDTSDWKTYRNEEYGFELRYPDFYVRDDEMSGWQDKTIVSLANFNRKSTDKMINGSLIKGEITNGLFVGIFNGDIYGYQLIDSPGGFVWCLDAATGSWADCRSKTAAGDYGPKRIAGNIEAYLYRSGDITCNWDYLIIPYKAKNKMMQIMNLTCGESYDFGNGMIDYKTPDFVLSAKTIMENFKFTDAKN